ncbi:unnamed protein product [Durusdinium trenchii]|uniref:PDZ domain-containing protein n=1 Tax=Durusdinium trenchii TaxID=1381693 RepID=A0ABP0QJK0_9DINO
MAKRTATCTAALLVTLCLPVGFVGPSRTAAHARVPAAHRNRHRVGPLGAKNPPDVRKLLEGAGLIPPQPTERWVPEEEALEFETPFDQLKQNIKDAFLQPNQEALVPQEEAVEFETPISQLSSFRPEELETPLEWIKKSVKKEKLVPEGEALKFETPISILFQEDEELEAEELWSDLLAPLLETDAVDTMNESNYLTVTVQKPLGLTVEENSKVAGGGVAVCGLEPNSNAERAGLRTGLQLLAAGGVPVHGMSLEDAIQPIEAAEDQVQLTFFMGSAEAFYGVLGPKPAWLSSFLHKLQIQHLAWQWQEGKTPQGRTWSWALELLDELRESDVDEETYSNAVVAAMEACQKASRWQPALKLLDDLCASSAAADLRAAYRAAVVTCDRGGEPLRAMWLLDEMKARSA